MTNRVPIPLGHTHIFSFIARAVYDATYFGVFDAIGNRSLTIPEVASACNLDEKALRSLFTLLTPLGYFSVTGNHFSLSGMAKKWLLKDSPSSIYDEVVFMREVWQWLAEMPDFLRTGKGLEYHDHFSGKEWELYQKGMYATAKSSAAEVAKKTPLPPHPLLMMDIGGSHGIYSVTLCKKHPGLKAVILDLPAAVEKARPILAQFDMGDRVVYEPGNALTYDFGENKFDLVFISSLMHHFKEEDNALLAQRIAKALKPGGYFVIQEFIRPRIAENAEMVGSALDLFFTLSSNAGTWSVEEIKAWQREAGLKHYKINKFLTMPGFAQVVAKKK